MPRRGHALYFFLTPAEQVALLEALEAHHRVAYYQAGVFAEPEAPAIASLASQETLGHLSSADWNHSPDYLLTFPGEEVVVRQIHLRTGGYAYAVDQGENPTLARLRPSGQAAPELLIAGSIDTFSRTSYSGRLFQAFSKLLKKRSRYIGGFWVGSQAEEKLRLGWRLVTNASAPRQYDVAVAPAPPTDGDVIGGDLAQKV